MWCGGRCLFDNFLGNTDRERNVELGVKRGTVSIWSYALHHASARFANPAFTPFNGPVW